MAKINSLIVYITCSDQGEARCIARSVVEKRLAACANIFQSHEAVYSWEGVVQSEAEVAMVLKTTSEKFEALKAEILKLHSYEVPCIVAVPIQAGHEPFLNWIQDQVK